MTKEEFNLSERIEILGVFKYKVYLEEDVKEFIRLLKEKINNASLIPVFDKRKAIFDKIDKLAGDKLK